MPKSFKQASINRYFGGTLNMAESASATTKPSARERASTKRTYAPRPRKAAFTPNTGGEGSHSDKSGHATLAPLSGTSAATTLEPSIHRRSHVGKARISRSRVLVKRNESTANSDSSSISEYAASGNASDTQGDIDSATDPHISDGPVNATQDSGDESDVVAQAAKRLKLGFKSISPQSGARKIAVRTRLVYQKKSAQKQDEPSSKKAGRKTAKDFQHEDNFKYRVGITENLKPLSKIEDIFADMTEKALALGFTHVLDKLNGRKLIIATMCSGTEAPVLATQLFSDALKKQGYYFEVEHVFSAEIVPFKQAYIERNFAPPIIFRDIKELSNSGAVMATTAYGGKAKIPDGIDLLVAGFSCVDFSSLNNEKKHLYAGGESGDTFKAILDYSRKYRPKIIILENVSGAPWDSIRDDAIPEIGYSAAYLRVDTKDYYIPHTRVRGYMICVDNRKFHDPNGMNHVLRDDEEVQAVLKNWMKIMKDLGRQASCSVEAFLLDEDDPRIVRGRDELSKSGRGDRRTKEVDWTRCYGRYQDYRANLLLGQKRPVMRWQEGGSCKPAEYMWQDWALGQVERVWDTIDIAFLRNLNRGFDDRYKLRLLELSQNIDRTTDSMAAGLAGCITPTGIPFSTIRGGPLLGLEALALQGLPIDKLQLSREKQSQLQDLAGNAMSSTVVGSAILAALIAAHRHLSSGDKHALSRSPLRHISKVISEIGLHPFSLDFAAYEALSVVNALDAAAKSSRLCLCEGREAITLTPLQQCIACKHISCIKCGGNPTHNYTRLMPDTVAERILPAEFQSMIQKAIPMTAKVSGITIEDIAEIGKHNESKIDQCTWKIFITAIEKALGSELRFRSTKRSEIWTISYDSGHAYMELILTSNEAEWRLYAKPEASEPVNSQIRQLLTLPIARMRPAGDDITKGMWQLWLPKEQKFEAFISGHGDLTRSFGDLSGVKKFADTKVWKEYCISIPNEAVYNLDAPITGIYTLLQDCGTASGSLHIQRNTADSATPLFMFLDPHRLHDPEHDFFVFSFDKRRLNLGETRPCIARLDASWRPQKLVEDDTTQVARYRFDGSKNLVTLDEARLPVAVKCFVDGSWINIPLAKFDCSGHAEVSSVPSDFSIRPSSGSCRFAHAIISYEAHFPGDESSTWHRNGWTEVSEVEQNDFYATFSWLTQKARTVLGLEEWRNIPYLSEKCSKKCTTCAPSTPAIKWRMETPKIPRLDPATAKIVTKRIQPLKQVAFEDPEEAATFERALKDRPSPLVTQIHINNVGLVKLTIAFNPETLIHRALAKLSAEPHSQDIKLSWRLITDYSPPAKVSQPVFTLKSNDLDHPASTPPGFKDGVALRPEQSRSLAWMIKQECDDVEAFLEEEVEEALIPHIGWRGEGCAAKAVIVKGGVLADQVGYGKTVTTLALIDSQRSRDAIMAEHPVEGRIPIKATLVLVPSQLPDQWESEIDRFLGKRKQYNVLVLKSIASLNGKTIADFEEADIIIAAWNFLEGDAYLFRIAHFAGMPEYPGQATTRASAAWYERALDEIAAHVEELKNGGKGLNSTIASKLKENNKEAASAETFIPSKRLRGQAYQNAKKNSATGSKRVREISYSPDPIALDGNANTSMPRLDVFGLGNIARGIPNWALNKKLKKTSKKDIKEYVPKHEGKPVWKSMKCPLFELFEFARVVVDEYTYVNGRESLTIPNLKAKSRWILSATPPLGDFMDIKSIAKFLGINLGIDDLTTGVIQPSNIRALEREKTNSEQFQSFRRSQSAAWHENRHAVAQRFLDQFVRQNIADVETITGHTHYMPVVLPAAERAIYLELNQLLVGTDFKMRRGKANIDNDRSRRIREVLGESSSAGEALLKSASHFTLTYLGDDLENAPDACDFIVNIRTDQCHRLKVDFRKKLKQAEWLRRNISEPAQQYGAWKRHVKNNEFGDLVAMKEIESMIAYAESSSKDGDWTEFYMTAEQMAEEANREEADEVKANAVWGKAKTEPETEELAGVGAGKKRKSVSKGRRSRKDKNAVQDSELDENFYNIRDENYEDSSGCVDDINRGKRSGERRTIGSVFKKCSSLPLKPVGTDEGKNVERANFALRDVTNELRKLSVELVSRRRCLRFFECVRHLQDLHSNSRKKMPQKKGCTCCTCRQHGLPPETISILSQCGHAICDKCFAISACRQLDECLVTGCKAVNKFYQVIRAPELGVEDVSTRKGKHYGKKLEDIIDLIQKIPKGEQVLLFVQFPDLMQKIASAFNDKGIRYASLADRGNAATVLTDFQTNMDVAHKDWKKVLILNIGDASAAGSNLTNANHVIFVSPFLTERQQTFDQAMTQAIGRARRYGQQKTVHVYHFLSLKTIDVDVIQFRTSKNLATGIVSHVPLNDRPYAVFKPSPFVLKTASEGEWGEFGSAETSNLLKEIMSD